MYNIIYYVCSLNHVYKVSLFSRKIEVATILKKNNIDDNFSLSFVLLGSKS